MQVQGMAATSPGLQTLATRPEAIRLTFFHFIPKPTTLGPYKGYCAGLVHGRYQPEPVPVGFTLSLHP